MTKKMTKEDVVKAIPDEKTLRESVAMLIFAQHTMEITMLQKTAGDKEEAMDLLRENLTHDIVGSTQLFMLYAEVYRTLVDSGKVEPVNVTSIATRLGMTPDKMAEMLEAGTKALERGDLAALVLSEDRIGFKAMSKENTSLYPERDEMKKVRREIVEAGLKKMRKTYGRED